MLCFKPWPLPIRGVWKEGSQYQQLISVYTNETMKQQLNNEMNNNEICCILGTEDFSSNPYPNKVQTEVFFGLICTITKMIRLDSDGFFWH